MREVGVRTGDAPAYLVEKVRIFYELYGSVQDIALAPFVAADYAGREKALFRQLQTKYRKGASFFAIWDEIETLFRLRDSGRIHDIGRLISKAQVGGLPKLLRDLQNTYKTTIFVEKGLLERTADDYNSHHVLVRNMLAKRAPKRLHSADTLLRAFEGHEERLVAQLSHELENSEDTPLRSMVPGCPAEAVALLSAKDTVIDRQAHAVHEYTAALRQEALRGDAALQQVPHLLAGALSRTHEIVGMAQIGENPELEQDAREGCKDLQAMAASLGLDMPLTGSRPAATEEELGDMEMELDDLRNATRGNGRALQRLATFCGIDPRLPEHTMRETVGEGGGGGGRGVDPVHPDAVLQHRAGAPLTQDEAVELIAMVINENMVKEEARRKRMRIQFMAQEAVQWG